MVHNINVGKIWVFHRFLPSMLAECFPAFLANLSDFFITEKAVDFVVF